MGTWASCSLVGDRKTYTLPSNGHSVYSVTFSKAQSHPIYYIVRSFSHILDYQGTPARRQGPALMIKIPVDASHSRDCELSATSMNEDVMYSATSTCRTHINTTRTVSQLLFSYGMWRRGYTQTGGW